MSHTNRGRIRCAPLTIFPAVAPLKKGLPQNLEPLAYLYESNPLISYGLLVRVQTTGRLGVWGGGALRNIDDRKAAAALEAMQKQTDEGHDWQTAPKTPGFSADAEKLAETLKLWRTGCQLPVWQAAEILGLPLKTYEFIEAGRGFRYPRLLFLAIAAFDKSLLGDQDK